MPRTPNPSPAIGSERVAPPEAGLIDLASAIAGKFADDAAWCRAEANWWEREADQHTHIPAYAAWARRRCADYRRDAAESERTVRRALQAATGSSTPTAL